MPLPVIANTFRITLLWNSHDGVQPRNVVHVQALVGDEAAVGQAFLDSLHAARSVAEPWQLVNGVYTFDSVEVLALDGTSSSVIVTDPTAAQTGQDSGNVLPSTAAIISLKTGTRGPRGRGRIYAGPCGENQANAGVFSASGVTEAQSAWDEVLVQCSANGVPLVVASYKHADAHAVTVAKVENVAGTQRRRQDQLR